MKDQAVIAQTSPSAEFWRGFMDIFPLMLGAIPFAMLLGSLAVQRGLSPFEVVLMSGFVFAGGAQFLAVEIWATPTPIVAIVVATLLVNLRHVLMGAALRPLVSNLPAGTRALFVSIHSDETWATALRVGAHRPLSVPYVIGLIVPFYFNWPFWGVIGALFGGLIEDPAAYGFDFVFTAVFLCLIVGLWQGRASAPPVLAGGLAALLAYHWLPGVWYVFLGGVVGTLAGAIFWRPESTDGSS